MSYAASSIFSAILITAMLLQSRTPVRRSKHTYSRTKVISSENIALHQGLRTQRSCADTHWGERWEREREKKAQVLLTIKVQIPHFMSALWFVYISRPWLIPLSFQPCLNPKPVTHLSQLQFKLSGKRKYRAGEVSHFPLFNFSCDWSLSTRCTRRGEKPLKSLTAQSAATYWRSSQ